MPISIFGEIMPGRLIWIVIIFNPKSIFGIRDITELQVSSLCDLHVILYVYISTQKGIDWESVKLASGVIKIDEL